MSLFSWILIAVGGYLVLHAALVLFRAGRGGGDTKKESLGCGFVVLAAVSWGIALSLYLDDWSAGLRLGLALALLLPVLATLLGGNRGRFIGSIVLLTVAVLIGGSAVPTLWAKVHPPRAQVNVDRIEKATEELRGRIAGTAAHLHRLHEDRGRLTTQLRGRGHADFAALAHDAAGLALLEELAELDRMAKAGRERLEQDQALLGRMDSALRRIRRLADAESAGLDLEQAEVDRILAQARQPLTTALGPATVEEHIRREQLLQLFERDVRQAP